MENRILLETLADIAYTAGYHNYHPGDSRAAISEFIGWAKEFDTLHEHTDWDSSDYIEVVDAFAVAKMRARGENNEIPTGG